MGIFRRIAHVTAIPLESNFFLLQKCWCFGPLVPQGSLFLNNTTALKFIPLCFMGNILSAILLKMRSAFLAVTYCFVFFL